jgi:four helix bundle protein
MGFNDELRDRTKNFSLRIITLFRSLPNSEEARIIGKQLLRSGCSVGANIHSATRAKSKAEYYSKLSIAIEEADESAFWMEILIEADIVPEKKLAALYTESIEITKILAVSRKTSKNNK